MAHDTPADTEAGFNELDPHGFEGHGQHASHVIVGPFTLRTVLGFLLLFTVLTVGLAQAEVAIQNALGITLPWWVNVAVAMSIAVVKSLMVMAYFMQLKYDNPINTVLMMFTFGALFLFLFFTGLDLFNRGLLDPQKQPQIIAGGTGKQVKGTGDKPLTLAAKERFLAHLKERMGSDEAALGEYERIHADVAGHGHASHDHAGVAAHTPSMSRPRTGLTGRPVRNRRSRRPARLARRQRGLARRNQALTHDL
jgi:cytochrome c oxidase subunit IV